MTGRVAVMSASLAVRPPQLNAPLYVFLRTPCPFYTSPHTLEPKSRPRAVRAERSARPTGTAIVISNLSVANEHLRTTTVDPDSDTRGRGSREAQRGGGAGHTYGIGRMYRLRRAHRRSVSSLYHSHGMKCLCARQALSFIATRVPGAAATGLARNAPVGRQAAADAAAAVNTLRGEPTLRRCPPVGTMIRSSSVPWHARATFRSCALIRCGSSAGSAGSRTR